MSERPPLRVAVVAEFYPRAHDPVLGVWAHRQALAARDAGAEVQVLVLHRPIPPLDTPRGERVAAAHTLLAQPRHAVLDGIPVRYVRFLAPPRPRSYGEWGRWAAPTLGRALRRMRRTFPYDLVHAHNAVPAGDAVRRTRLHDDVPLVVSVHGGDVFYTASHSPAGAAAAQATFAAAQLVLANSTGIEERAAALGAARTRVVRLGADLPEHPPALGRQALARQAATQAARTRAGAGRTGAAADEVTLVTVGHLVGRKRHADVLRALWLLRDRRPELPPLRYLVIGDGPERAALEQLAAQLDLTAQVTFTGQLDHDAALARLQAEGQVFVMPSVDEALGVAYLEAMAAGLPAVAAAGEPGPQEIAAAGDGLLLVPPADVEELARAIGSLVEDPEHRYAVGTAARATVAASFTWAACGAATVAAYEEALGR